MRKTRFEVARHSFDQQKEELRKFSETSENHFVFRNLDIRGGLFGMVKYKVTGEDFNEFTRKMSDVMIKNQQNINYLTAGFGTVYKTIETLDSDYIAGIVQNVEQIKEVSDRAENAAESASQAVQDIGKTVKSLMKLKDVVKRHSEQLENLQQQLRSQEKLLEKAETLSSAQVIVYASQKMRRLWWAVGVSWSLILLLLLAHFLHWG